MFTHYSFEHRKQHYKPEIEIFAESKEPVAKTYKSY